MLDALLHAFFSSGYLLSEHELSETKKLTSSIHAKGDDDEQITDRLCELAVLWVSKNPNPILLNKLNYDSNRYPLVIGQLSVHQANSKASRASQRSR